MRETCMVHHFSQRWNFAKFRSKLFLEILVLQKYFVKSWFQGMFRLKWCISNEISNEIYAKTLFWSESSNKIQNVLLNKTFKQVQNISWDFYFFQFNLENETISTRVILVILTLIQSYRKIGKLCRRSSSSHWPGTNVPFPVT